MVRIVCVHGAATTARIWDRLIPLLPEYDVVAVERPRSGDLDQELEWLAPHVEGSWVLGVSGGATLGLALAASDTPIAGAILHEPAVGRLAPGLLAPFAETFEQGGTQAFGRALYGDSWSLDQAPAGGDPITTRELAMFQAFEPQRSAPDQGRVLITVGGSSPPARHLAARALRDDLGYEIQTLPAARHYIPYEAPQQLASLVRDVIGASGMADTKSCGHGERI